MKLKSKPTIIIIGTLFIGMILGALLLSIFMRYRLQRLHTMMGRHGFHKSLIEAISPLSPAQEASVKSEIDLSSVRIDSTINAGRVQIDAMIDSMMTRLDSLLTPEQRVRLHKELGARFGKGGPPHMGMPFGGPPPGDMRLGGPPPHGGPDDRPPPHDHSGDAPPPQNGDRE